MKDFWIETGENEKKLNKRKTIITVTGICIITLLLVLISIYIANKDMRNWIDVHLLRKQVTQNNVATIEIKVEENPQVYAFDKYIGVLNKNNLKLYNSTGKEEKEVTVEVNNAIFTSNDKFLGIAESNGQNIYLLSGQNVLWNHKIEGNISQIHVNKNGYMAVVIVDTSYKTVISLYGPDGKDLFKTYLSATRVADISISDDNKYLALAEIDTSGTMIQSNVKVISIDKTQADSENAVKHIYNADANRLITNIKYQDKNKLVCMYQDGIDTMIEDKTNNLAKIEGRKVTFASIELAGHIAIVEEKSSGLFSTNSEVQIDNINSQKQSMYQVNQVAKEIYTNQEIIALNFGTEIHFINTGGWLIKKYVSNQEITKVVLSNNLGGIVYRDKIEIVNL